MPENRLPFILDEAASRFAGRPALYYGEQKICYQTYQSQVDILAASLSRSALRPGDRLALLGRPAIEYAQLIMAVIRAGFIAVPLDVRQPQLIIKKLLSQVQAALILSQSKYPTEVYNCQVISWDTVFAKAQAQNIELSEEHSFLHNQQPVSIIFTSGSSQKPKAVVHSYANHYYSALGSNTNIQLGKGDCWLLSLPLHHVSGFSILFRVALGGAAVRIIEPNKSLKEKILQYRPSHVSLVASQLTEFLDDAEIAPVLAEMKSILLGGGPISYDLLDKSYRLRLPIHVSYGSTEMTSQITTTPPHASFAMLQTAGRPLPFRELQIGKTGKIQVRGKSLFAGYWQKGKIAAAVDGEGWFSTGDIGHWDEDGNLLVDGRQDRMFISGGENIYPEEIERAISRLGLTEQVCVIPVNDQKFGQRPVAFIQLKNESEIGSIRWKEILSPYLPPFKIPVVFLQWPQDIQISLKIDYRRLQQLADKAITNAK